MAAAWLGINEEKKENQSHLKIILSGLQRRQQVHGDESCTFKMGSLLPGYLPTESLQARWDSLTTAAAVLR